MKCACCKNKQAVLIKMPVTLETEDTEIKIIREPKESICIACIVSEMFEVMFDQYEEKKEEKEKEKKEEKKEE